MRRPLARSMALNSGRRIPIPDLNYDASLSDSVSLSGSNVAQWNDIANGRNIVQGTAANQPIYGTVNSRQAVIFDGTNDILTATGAATGVAGVTDVTFFLVASWIALAGEDIPVGLGQTGSTRAIRCLYRPNASSSLGFGTWANDVTSGPSVDAGGAPHLHTQAQTGRSVFQSRDNVNDSVYPRSVSLDPLPISFNGISIGSLQGANVISYYTNFAVHQLLVYYSFLPEAMRQLIGRRLMQKWSIS